MKNLLSRLKLSYRHKLFLLIATVLIIPTLIILIMNILIVEKDIRNNANRSNIDLLEQTKLAADSVIELVERGLEDLYFDASIMNFFALEHECTTFDDYTILGNAKIAASNYIENPNYYINGVYLYNFTTDIMLTPYGQINYNFGLVNDPVIRLMHEKNPYNSIWLSSENSDLFSSREESTVMLRFVYRNMQLKGLVAVKLNINQFEGLLEKIHILRSGQVMVMDKNFEAVMNAGVLDPDFIHSIKDNFAPEYRTSQNYVNIDYKEETFLVAYVNSIYKEWRYVSVLRASELENTAETVTRKVMMIYVAAVGIFALIAYAAAGGILNPFTLIYDHLKGTNSKKTKLLIGSEMMSKIDQEISSIQNKMVQTENLSNHLMHDRANMKLQLDENISSMKEYFMLKILNNDVYDFQEMEKLGAYLGFPERAQYCVSILDLSSKNNEKVDSLSYFSTHPDLSNLKDIVANVLQYENIKMKSQLFYAESNIIIILIIEEIIVYNESIMENIDNLFCRIQKAISVNLGFSMTVSVGSVVNDLPGINASYQISKNLLNLKFILGTGSIISAYKNKEKISPINSKFIKLITNSLYSNNISEAIMLISDLKNHLVSNFCDISVVKFYIKEMMYVVFQYMCESEHSNPGILEDYYQNFSEFDIRFENIDQAINYICEKLKIINELPDAGISLLVIKVLKIVKQEYEKNLTLQDVAKRLNVSVSYLSRIFKDSIGKNFKEYLIEAKIKQSKEKLKNKDLSINDIAESVGYNDPGQFSRIFKKYEGMTPAQFRLTNHIDHIG